MEPRRYLLHVLDPGESVSGYVALVLTVDSEARTRFMLWKEATAFADTLKTDLSHLAFHDDVSVEWRGGIEDSDFHDKLYAAGVLAYPGELELPGLVLDVDCSLAISNRAGLAWEARIGSDMIETMEAISWETLLGE